MTGGSCGTNQYATSVGSNGTPTCAQVGYSQVSGAPTIPAAQVAANLASSGSTGVTGTLPANQVGGGYPAANIAAGTAPISITGNAATATAINGNGTANQVWGMNSGAQGWQTVPGGGSVDVNGSTVSSLNLNSTTPSVDSGFVAGTWKCSGSNCITEVPSSVAVTSINCTNSSTDQTTIAAADAAGANIGIVSGTCLFSSNVTLNGTYWFFGGKFAPSSSVTVTFTQEPQATPTQIFTGSGLIVLAGAAATAYPEWWGTTGNSASYTDQVPFNAAAAALTKGVVWLTKPAYYGCGFSNSKGAVNVSGTGGVLYATPLNCNSATATIFSATGTGANCSGGSYMASKLSSFRRIEM